MDDGEVLYHGTKAFRLDEFQTKGFLFGRTSVRLHRQREAAESDADLGSGVGVVMELNLDVMRQHGVVMFQSTSDDLILTRSVPLDCVVSCEVVFRYLR